MRADRRLAWAFVTTWAGVLVAAAGAVLLVVLAYTGPSGTVTEVDFSGLAVFATRLVGAVFLAVLTLSCLLQAAILLPRSASRRPGLPAPAVIDLLLIAGVVVEVALVLSVGFADDPDLDTAIVGTGLLIALVAVVRFVVVVASGLRERAAHRLERDPR